MDDHQPAACATADIDRLRDFLAASRRLLVLTGAGCSTESGIPDYRDADGNWKRGQPIQHQDFVRSPSARQRYWARSLIGWSRIEQAEPNPAHHALARLESAGFVRCLVTQNVDGLHQKAGSRRVIDLHGRLDTVECLVCRRQTSRRAFQAELQRRNPDWLSMDAAIAPDGDVDLEGIDFSAFRVPACDRCSGVLKPGVVFFGGAVPQRRIAAALDHLNRADALLVVGSSLMVFSGYRFARAAARRGVPVVVINVGRTRADQETTIKVEARCGEILPGLVDQMILATTRAGRRL